MVSGAKAILAAEYFIDTDPGAGKGTPLDPKDGNFNEEIEPIALTAIDTCDLTVGLHKLYIRMKNSEGAWGVPRQYTFEVAPSTPDDGSIAGSEFFIDNDPGFSQGIPMSAADGNFDEPNERAKAVFDTAGLSIGNHSAYVRMKDADGKWSQPAKYQPFEINNEILYDLTMSGSISTPDYQPAPNIEVCLEGPVSGCEAITDANGQYTLGTANALAEGDYIVKPQSQKFTFEPESKQIRITDNSIYNINFKAYPKGSPLALTLSKPVEGFTLARGDTLPVEVIVNDGLDATVLGIITNEADILQNKFEMLLRFGSGGIADVPITVAPGNYTLTIWAFFQTDAGEMQQAVESRNFTFTPGDIYGKRNVRIHFAGAHTDNVVPRSPSGGDIFIDVEFSYRTGDAISWSEPAQLTLTKTANGGQQETVSPYETIDEESPNAFYRFQFPAGTADVTHDLHLTIMPPAGTPLATYEKDFQVQTSPNITAHVEGPDITVDGRPYTPGDIVMTGQEVEFSIHLKNDQDQPIEGADISATVQYLEIGGAPLAEPAYQPKIFLDPDSNVPGLYRAVYLPSTGGKLGHKFAFNFVVPGYVNPAPVEKEIIVESDQLIHNSLKVHNDRVIQQLTALNNLAQKTKDAGDYFTERRLDKEIEFWANLIDASIQTAAAGYATNQTDEVISKHMDVKTILYNKRSDIAISFFSAIGRFLEDYHSGPLAGMASYVRPMAEISLSEDAAGIGSASVSILENLTKMLTEPEPFGEQLIKAWNSISEEAKDACESDGSAILNTYPVQDIEIQKEIGGQIGLFRMANQVIVDEAKVGLSKLHSTYYWLNESEENTWRKIHSVVLEDVMPLLISLQFTPATGAAYSAGLSSIKAAIATLHDIPLCNTMIEFSTIGLCSTLHDSLGFLVWNSSMSHRYLESLRDVQSVSDIPSLPEAEIQILGEFEEGHRDFKYWKTILRKFVRVQITNTGDKEFIFFPKMFYHKLFPKLYESKLENIAATKFHMPNWEIVSNLTLQPNESQTIEFDLFRWGYSQFQDIHMVPKKGTALKFHVLGIAAEQENQKGMTYALRSERSHQFKDDFVFEEIPSRRSKNHRASISVRIDGEAEDESILMPISVKVSRTSGDNNSTVLYNLKNHFNAPVNYELIQPLPDGMSAVSEDAEIATEGLRFIRTLAADESATFQWNTVHEGAEDFELPAATLTFIHPYNAATIEIDIMPDPVKASEIAPMMFGLEGARVWPIDRVSPMTFSITNDYAEDKTVAIHAVLTDSQGNQAEWHFTESAPAGTRADIPLFFDLGDKSLAAGDAELNIDATPEDGPTLTAISALLIAIQQDADNDGLPDDWETENGLDPSTHDAALDKDNDGLTNAQELEQGTNPCVADTDGDGLEDGEEINTYSTDPLLADTDGGGDNDGVEVSEGRDPASSADDQLDLSIHVPESVGIGETALATWTISNPFLDSVQYKVSIGSKSGAADVISWEDNGKYSSYAIDTSSFTNADKTYFVNVEVIQNGSSQGIFSESFEGEKNEKGDINSDGNIDLIDVIATLQTIAGLQTAVNINADANGDEIIGLPDAIYLLQSLAR